MTIAEHLIIPMIGCNDRKTLNERPVKFCIRRDLVLLVNHVVAFKRVTSRLVLEFHVRTRVEN